MSKGRRYSEEGQLNYVKVFAVIIAILVIWMCTSIIKNIFSRGKETTSKASECQTEGIRTETGEEGT